MLIKLTSTIYLLDRASEPFEQALQWEGVAVCWEQRADGFAWAVVTAFGKELCKALQMLHALPRPVSQLRSQTASVAVH